MPPTPTREFPVFTLVNCLNSSFWARYTGNDRVLRHLNVLECANLILVLDGQQALSYSWRHGRSSWDRSNTPSTLPQALDFLSLLPTLEQLP